MLFNSSAFLIFFLAVISAYQLPLSWPFKKTFLLLASYYFYSCWNPPFLLLLWLSTVMDWFLAKSLYSARGSSARRLLLFLSLLMNLGLLGFFKYGNFFLDNGTELLRFLGFSSSGGHLDVILPVGISFYTFQTLSYTLDVYMGKRKPADSFLDYALYIAFFPQLVAGPIVRSEDFLPQCKKSRRATPAQFQWGLSLMVIGLFEKMVIADLLMAPVSEKIYGASVTPGFVDAWIGTLAFSVQIFCDFAGYSTCAIGAALCFGFALTRNFHFPFAAVGFSDYWRRWHISLSTWLRDYLYIPLGGNRHGTLTTYRNLMLTMLLGGFWHGASWTFVVWGGLHGLFLCLEKFAARFAFLCRLAGRLWVRVILGCVTYLCVSLAWVFFRSHGISQAFRMIHAMSGAAGAGTQGPLLSLFQVQMVILAAGLLAGIHCALRRTTLKRVLIRIPAWVRGIGLTLMVVLIWASAGEDRAFIYFQF